MQGGIVRAGRIECGAAALTAQPSARPRVSHSVVPVMPANIPPVRPEVSSTQQWADPEEPLKKAEPFKIPDQLREQLLPPPDAPNVRPAPRAEPFRLPDLNISPHGGDTERSSRSKPEGKRFVAIQCPKLHLNEPAAPACRICYLPLELDAPQLETLQPALGWLQRAGTSERWEVVNPVILIGRAPGFSAVDRLALTLSGVSAAIADLHVEARLSGFRMEVMDRSGRRGTHVINPDGRKVRLEPGAPIRLRETGSIVLADEVTLTFEVDR
ncbi:hypothetical protein Rhe02_75050 [Rhizocola hellebori]|uniref:FHA domain-containing protein n=1 Tax=Rhizocola hellebori TaxID=1392758 RepID=A0A8J3QEK4_9ACTN|nr:hypothetical protein Rhe02_75050 [Rhizocola hellebori]